jgi:hypothetical protein
VRWRGWPGIAIGAAVAAVSVAVVVGVAVVVAGWTRDSAGPGCPAALQSDEAKVRTDRWPVLTDELPGIGDFVDIHWQLRAAGDPCSRAPGPTDWRYEGVLRLRPEDARALGAGYDWQPVPASASPGTSGFDTPDLMWPALVPFVAPGARWLHSATYAGTHFQQSKSGDLYLDEANSQAFFVLLDH